MAFPGDDESDWKFKIALQKVPVVSLDQAANFPAWHLSLRRLVTGCSIAYGLLYSVQSHQLADVKSRIQSPTESSKVKRESESLSTTSSSSSSSATTTSSSKTHMFVDLSEEKVPSPLPK